MAVEFKDYYKILGVDRKADEKAIKSAFRRLARKHHPDVAKGKDSAERFKEINEANEVLSDPEKRRRYDSLGPDWQRYAQQRPGGPGRRPAGSASNTATSATSPTSSRPCSATSARGAAARAGAAGSREGVEFDVEDLLGGGRAGARSRMRGGDVQANVEITLDEAFHGVRKNFTLQMDEPCPTCHGAGNVKGHPAPPATVKAGSGPSVRST